MNTLDLGFIRQSLGNEEFIAYSKGRLMEAKMRPEDDLGMTIALNLQRMKEDLTPDQTPPLEPVLKSAAFSEETDPSTGFDVWPFSEVEEDDPLLEEVEAMWVAALGVEEDLGPVHTDPKVSTPVGIQEMLDESAYEFVNVPLGKQVTFDRVERENGDISFEPSPLSDNPTFPQFQFPEDFKVEEIIKDVDLTLPQSEAEALRFEAMKKERAPTEYLGVYLDETPSEELYPTSEVKGVEPEVEDLGVYLDETPSEELYPTSEVKGVEPEVGAPRVHRISECGFGTLDQPKIRK
jgi:hypothetical protein